MAFKKIYYYVILWAIFLTFSGGAANSYSYCKACPRLLAITDSLQEIGSDRESLRYCHAALERAISTKDSLYILQLPLYFIEAYMHLSNWDSVFVQLEIMRLSIVQIPDLKKYYDIQLGYYLNYGEYLKMNDQIEKAIEIYETAEKFIRSKSDYYREEKQEHSQRRGIDYVDFNFRMKGILQRRASLHSKNGNYQQANDQLSRALTFAIIADQNRTDDPQYNELNVLLEILNNNIHYKNSDELIEKISKMIARIPTNGTYAQKNGKNLYHNLLKYLTRLNKKAEDIITLLVNNPNAKEDPNVFFDISEYYYKNKQLDASLKSIEKAEWLAKKQSINKSLLSKVDNRRARIAVESGDFIHASALLNNSILRLTGSDLDHISVKQASIRNNGRAISEYLSEASFIYHKMYQASQELKYADKVIQCGTIGLELLQPLRNIYFSGDDRILLVQSLQSLFENVFHTYLSINKEPDSPVYAESILKMMEANKSLNLLDDREIRTRLNAKDLDHYNSLVKKINKQKLQLQKQTNDQEYNLLEQEMAEINDDYRDFMFRVNQNQEASNSVLDLSIHDIRSKLAFDQCLIEYFEGDLSIYVLIINKKHLNYFEIIKTDSLSAAISKLRMMIDSRTGGEAYNELSHWFYNLLINPLNNYLSKRIILVPDGELNQIPFASLLTERINSKNTWSYPYLLRKHSIAWEYSANLWLQTLSKKSIQSKNQILGFAPAFNDLRFNIAELETIQSKFNDPALYKRAKASKSVLINLCSNYNIIHISSHALSDENRGESSYIRFADGVLSAWEVMSLQVNASLVFLSGCETGIGQMIHGEGMISLARAFFAAGAKSVISTIWKVNDNANSNMVSLFYEHLLKGKAKDLALQDAQIDFLEKYGHDSQHPFFWSAFQVQGDYRPIFQNKFSLAGNILQTMPVFSYSVAGFFIFSLLFNRKKYRQAA